MGPVKLSNTILKILLFSFLYSHQSLAQYRILNASYGGTGCPAGSASIAITNDRHGFIATFDQMIAEAGSNINRKVDRKSCTVRLGLDVSAGYQVKIRPLNIDGFVQVPSGGQAHVETKTSFVGLSKPVSFLKTFKGPRHEAFQIKNELVTQEQLWTPCGRKLIVEYGISLSAITNAQSESTGITTEGLIFGDKNSPQPIQFELRRCQ